MSMEWNFGPENEAEIKRAIHKMTRRHLAQTLADIDYINSDFGLEVRLEYWTRRFQYWMSFSQDILAGIAWEWAEEYRTCSDDFRDIWLDSDGITTISWAEIDIVNGEEVLA